MDSSGRVHSASCSVHTRNTAGEYCQWQLIQTLSRKIQIFYSFQRSHVFLCSRFGKTLFYVSIDYLFQKFHINRIIQHTVFCNLLVLLSTVFSGQNVVRFSIWFLLRVIVNHIIQNYKCFFFVHLVINKMVLWFYMVQMLMFMSILLFSYFSFMENRFFHTLYSVF